MDLKNIPVKIINLDRRTDRWDNIKNTNFSFNSVERFSAYDGSKDNELKDASVLTKLTIDSNTRRYHEEISTKGGYACHKSHIALWRELVQSNYPYYIIMEDDLVLTRFNKDYSVYDFVEEKYKLIEKSKKDFDIWLIGYIGLRDCKLTPNTEITPSETFNEPELACTLPESVVNVTSFFGAHCYMISREIATELLKSLEPIMFHIDGLLSFFSQLGKVNIIALTNKEDIISQGVFESDLNHNSGNVCNFSSHKLPALMSKNMATSSELANLPANTTLYKLITIIIILIVILLIIMCIPTNVKLVSIDNPNVIIAV